MKGIRLILFTSCIWINTFSQNQKVMPNIPKAPEVASFMRYIEMPVSLYTGMIDITLPLYNLEIDEVKLPITLSYHNGGVKVEEEASWVGLGWNMNIGGCIFRALNGTPDDEAIYGWLTQDTKMTPDPVNDITGPYYTERQCSQYNSPTTDCDFLPTTDMWDYRSANYDLEPDDFIYSFLGHSGHCSFDKTGNLIKTEKNNLIITPIFNNDGVIISWEIQDENGTLYKFAWTQEQYYYRSHYANISYETYTGSWFLNQIVTTKGKIINFNYTSGNLIISSSSWSYSYDCLRESTASDIQETENMYTCGYLNGITTTPDVGSITFNISGGRQDLENGFKLDNLIVKNSKSETVKRYDFAYDYFTASTTGNATNTYNSHWAENMLTYSGNYATKALADQATVVRNSRRLKLLRVKEVSSTGDTLNPYVFLYNTAALPVKTSFNVDHWGYFNNASNSALSCKLPSLVGRFTYINESHYQYTNSPRTFWMANRSSSEDGQACMLKQIIYPTKGTLALEYQRNVYNNVDDFEPYTTDASGTIVIRQTLGYGYGGGFRVKSITNTDNITGSTVTKTLNYSNGRLLSIPRYWRYYNDAIPFTCEICTPGAGCQPGNGVHVATRIIVSSYSNSCASNPLSGSHVGYEKVQEVVTISGGGNYVTEYTYHNDPNNAYTTADPFNLDVTYAVVGPFVPEVPDLSNGTLISKVEKNSAGSIINSAEYNYTPNQTYNNFGVKFFYLSYILGYCNGVDISSQVNHYRFIFCPKNTDYINILNYITEIHDGVSKTTNYYYDNPLFFQPTRIETINSKGETLKTIYKYPLDYSINTNSTPIQLMRDNNIVNTLIEQQEWNKTNLISATYNEYDKFGPSSNIPLLKKVYKVETLTPLSGSTFKGLDTYGNLLSSTQYVPKMSINYDNNSLNPISLQKTNDIITCYIYSYNNSYPIAKIDNVDYSTVQTVIGGSTVIKNFGDKSSPTDTEIKTFLAPLYSNGQLGNAMIKTYTYKPLIGMTSETDEKGVTTYYEYDAFGRLQYVKDQDLKVIKEYKYNYKH